MARSAPAHPDRKAHPPPATSGSVRAALLLAATLLAAGCLNDPGAPSPSPSASPSPSPPPAASPSPAPPTLAPPAGPCPLVAVEAPARLAQWELAPIWANVTNCGAEPVRLASDPLCRYDRNLRAHVVGEDQSFAILHGPGYLHDPARGDCGGYPPSETRLAPGEAWSRELAWDASFQMGECDPGCDSRHLVPADVGPHLLVVSLRLPNGTTAFANATIEVTPAVPPPLPPPGPIRILLNGTYRANESVEVWIENVGNETYSYNSYYEACGWRYYDDAARPFRIPPGTHCDLINRAELAPGEKAKVFDWAMQECVVDMWGCAEAAPLAAGRYHVRATFCQGDMYGGARVGCVPAGATFRVE